MKRFHREESHPAPPDRDVARGYWPGRFLASGLFVSVALTGLSGCGKSGSGAAPSEAPPGGEAREPTAVRPAKKTEEVAERPSHVFWGDEHVHSGWSVDAGLNGTTLTPEDAVRFARGQKVKATNGQPAQLHRALDWIAVTDHSDGMGTMGLIEAGNPEMMKDPTVKRWHDMMKQGGEAADKATWELIRAQATRTLPKVLMDPKWMESAWEKTVDIMEKYNEPEKFTAFIAYEWTSNGERGENLHRNVIFRDGAEKTRSRPPLTTFVSAAPGRKSVDPESLWAWLDQYESETGGQVLAIPHNGNLSNGWMFREARYDGSPLTPEWAKSRARWEPLYEVFQYKGFSEAHPKLSPTDEFSDAEIWDTGDLSGNPKKPGNIEYEYLRQALREGLRLQAKLGTNPFHYGMAAGSDTHNALPTGSEEDNFLGKFPKGWPRKGRWNEVFSKEKNYVRREWTEAAAGIMGVWAQKNTREDLFDAMKRREVFASSGPRMTARFFGGFDFQKADTKGNLAATGYAKGVPMGAKLKGTGSSKTPSFLIAAQRDPEGANLDRVQVIKGWVDSSGEPQEKIYDVIWSGDRKLGDDGKLPPVGSTVDLQNATYKNSIGAPELVGVFEDPDFDPSERAFYYVRVLEIPTPRWTAYDAVRFQETMAKDVPMVIQERVVTSPIWYEPTEP